MPKTMSTYPRIRWHNSLIFRVILLCAVLVVCLLGSVYVIAFHYFGEMAKEMESQTLDIASNIVLHFEQNLDADLRKVESDMMDRYKGTKVELNDVDDLTVVIPFTIERDENGNLAKVTLRLPKGTLQPGADADITILDPDRPWVFDRDRSASKSRNTPFHGWPLKGKAVATIVAGNVVWREENLKPAPPA